MLFTVPATLLFAVHAVSLNESTTAPCTWLPPGSTLLIAETRKLQLGMVTLPIPLMSPPVVTKVNVQAPTVAPLVEL